MNDVPRSFIREILKDALQPDAISFAGGLPNPDLFPTEALQNASQQAFATYGNQLLQYSESEGFFPLRQWIADRYKKFGLKIDPNQVLITSGSQQGLDLLGKVFLNDNDAVIIEEPGYLGAIQAFSLFRPQFLPVPISDEGMDVECLEKTLTHNQAKLIYTVPNFQNPTGITYPNKNRQAVADILKQHSTFLIEDNPYGELRFEGQHQQSFYELLPNKTILLGSFSKTVVPGFRLGWMVVPESITEKIIIAKQAADLHTNQLAQCIIYQYLQNNDVDAHINSIISMYGSQKDAMTQALSKYFPTSVDYTQPQGGMFLWAKLPEELAAIDLFHQAAKAGVLFVPGDPFYTDRTNVSTLRLNYTCSDVESIDLGIKKLGELIS